MVTRVALIVGLSLVFIAGTLAIANRMIVAQAPSAPAASVPPAAAQADAQPAAPVTAPPAATVKTPPAAAPPTAPAPVAAAPASAAPTPDVSAAPAPTAPTTAAGAPPAPQPTPVVSAPAAPQPAPVVSAPPAAEPTPIVTAPPPAAPEPVVTAPPATPPTPVVTAPPTAPVVSAPTVAPPATAMLEPPLPPKRPDMSEEKMPAKLLFSAKKLPSLGKAMAIGYYPRGCLQGGVELPVNGPTWQVMRLSRNRNWGHPELVKFLERFAPLAAKATGWHGILIGDMAQPRGGPLPFGHLSHQIGLDVDIWFMPMPGHELSREEREKISASNLVADDWKHINPKTWSQADVAFIRTAAEQPEVERVLVNAAIKKELCRVEGKHHYSWMAKVRPWYGHNDHIHVRLKCPADSPHCRKQPPVPGDDGCSDKQLAYWFSDKVLHPPKPTKPAKPGHALTLADLPPACKTVLDAPAKDTVAADAPR